MSLLLVVVVCWCNCGRCINSIKQAQKLINLIATNRNERYTTMRSTTRIRTRTNVWNDYTHVGTTRTNGRFFFIEIQLENEQRMKRTTTAAVLMMSTMATQKNYIWIYTVSTQWQWSDKIDHSHDPTVCTYGKTITPSYRINCSNGALSERKFTFEINFDSFLFQSCNYTLNGFFCDFSHNFPIVWHTDILSRRMELHKILIFFYDCSLKTCFFLISNLSLFLWPRVMK